MRKRRVRVLSPVALLIWLALVATACGSDEPSASEVTATAFAAALSRSDVAAAAALTTDPAAATTSLTQVFTGLAGNGTTTATPSVAATVADPPAGVDGAVGTATLAVTWTFAPPTGAAAPAPDRRWQYSTTATLVDSAGATKVRWDPAAIVPGLTAQQTVRYTPLDAEKPATVIGGDGAPLMSERVVTVVTVDATADTAAVASLVNPSAPSVSADSIRADLAAAGGKPVTVVTLRDTDIAPVRDRLSALAGVSLSDQRRLLTEDRALRSPVLAGITDLWQKQQVPGWAVQVVDADGSVAQQAAGAPGTGGPDIAVTLDPALQLRAESALGAVASPAAIVALRPSTGAVLAVAQNDAADAQGPIALTGLYPPGSTFKTVTTSAVLQAGSVTPDTVLGCPGTENIEGRQIPNDDNFDLGQVPLHTAFARSCNTTMGRLAVDLPDDALTSAALQFGLGVDYVTPGLTTVTGSVPAATTSAERVESAIGQGTVTASPFGMALVAASIAHGSTPLPTMIAGQPATANQNPSPPAPAVTDALKKMMAEVVSAGTATSLRDIDGLIGKTGTAEVQGGPAHGWFIGIRGDLAFAVFVAGAGSSAPALAAAGALVG